MKESAKIAKAAEYRANWLDERNSAALYRSIAKLEKNDGLKKVFAKLAEAEDVHSLFWEDRLTSVGERPPKFRLAWRTRTLILLARLFGSNFVLPNIVPLEQVDSHKYDMQPEAKVRGLHTQEQSHARLLRAITTGSRAGLEGSQIARIEGRHRALGGNALRAAVLGANDGLLSNFSLVMGVAGASSGSRPVMIAGLAGLLAGACSMALGEWLSVQSARELYERQILVEKQEVEEIPEEEKEELALIYQAKGLSEEDARNLAEELIRDKANALDALAREELGVDPDALGGSAWVAGGTSFCLFAAGAIIPVAPFILPLGAMAIPVSVAVSALSLFVIGAAITLLTGRNAFRTGARQVLLGLIASGITFGLGKLIGSSIS